ncbi:MAG: hypothetical protein Kapaf2KO_21640 [Candidatus Kapaibacteriales bacterium]
MYEIAREIDTKLFSQINLLLDIEKINSLVQLKIGNRVPSSTMDIYKKYIESTSYSNIEFFSFKLQTAYSNLSNHLRNIISKYYQTYIIEENETDYIFGTEVLVEPKTPKQRKEAERIKKEYHNEILILRQYFLNFYNIGTYHLGFSPRFDNYIDQLKKE